MVNNKIKKRSAKQQSLIELLLLLIVIIVVNVLSYQYYKQFDLTKEKRFTLTQTSADLAKSIDDRIYFKIYLDGPNLSSKFKRLRTSILDKLRDFRNKSGNKIDFEFVNVLEGKDEKEKSTIIKELFNKGCQYYNDLEIGTDQEKRNLILPCGIVSDASGKEYVINFLTTEAGKAEETAINKSIEGLEYEIANSIRKCLLKKPKKIAFLYGHGEPEAVFMDDLLTSLNDNFGIDRYLFNLSDQFYLEQLIKENERNIPLDSLSRLIIQRSLENLKYYDGIVIVKPTEPLQKDEAYIIDQYIMNGGKVVWMIDPIMAEHDSLRRSGKGVFPDYNNEMARNLLFNYGVRLNANLLQDLNCNIIVLNDPSKNNMKIPMPWVYYPLFSFSENNHPIVKNLEVVWGQYAGTLKPINRSNLKVTNLLVSSPKTKMQEAPCSIELNLVELLRNSDYLKTYKSGLQVSGVLLEGEFKSFFYRPDNSFEFPVKKSVKDNKMIVIADGDLPLNRILKSSGTVFPLGYDIESGRQFANKKFLLNCFDYLFDQNGLIDIRTKEINLRLLNKAEIQKPKEENELLSVKQKWQLFNTILPVSIVILIGLLNHFYRRIKYTKN